MTSYKKTDGLNTARPKLETKIDFHPYNPESRMPKSTSNVELDKRMKNSIIEGKGSNDHTQSYSHLGKEGGSTGKRKEVKGGVDIANGLNMIKERVKKVLETQKLKDQKK